MRRIIFFPICFVVLSIGLLYGNALCRDRAFQHTMRLQLSDANGFPVEGTAFDIMLDIIEKGQSITIQVPLINFQTGQTSSADPFLPTLVPGGYLYTVDGYLPQDIAPTTVVPHSIVAASNNGMSPVFSFIESATQLPQPPVGYIVQVTNAGALQVQGAGTFGNVIAPGPQVLLPCSITYLRKPQQFVCKNYTLSTGATSITQFTQPYLKDHGFRDSHVCDAFSNVLAWTWSDNAHIDQSSNILNAMVLLGSVADDGSFVLGVPTQLTDLSENQMVWDTAVCINRTNIKNIVVSFQLIDASQPLAPEGTPVRIPYRSVTYDGGVTWQTGPVENIIEPRDGRIWSGDNRGVSCDQFGNIWYSTTQFFDETFTIINQPLFAVSRDGGLTFEVAYRTPPVQQVGIDVYDYPQYCFGGLGDQMNTYGLWFTLDYFRGPDIIPVVGFVPVMNDMVGTGTIFFFNDQPNTQELPTITASLDGRVWIESLVDNPASYISPVVLRYKSPGALDQNYAGLWDIGFVNQLNTHNLANQRSFSLRGYIQTATQSNIYDEQREALYALYAAQSPDHSQNMRIYFMISRNNGLTWSLPIEIANTSFANRGYQSMALDTKTGNLIFGWYDGRNDVSFESVEYFAGIIPATVLDALVQSTPVSDPVFEV